MPLTFLLLHVGENAFTMPLRVVLLHMGENALLDKFPSALYCFTWDLIFLLLLTNGHTVVLLHTGINVFIRQIPLTAVLLLMANINLFYKWPSSCTALHGEII